MCPSVRAQVRGGSLGGLETIKPSGCAEHEVIHLRDNKEGREGKKWQRERGPRRKRANGWKTRRRVGATGRQIGQIGEITFKCEMTEGWRKSLNHKPSLNLILLPHIPSSLNFFLLQLFSPKRHSKLLYFHRAPHCRSPSLCPIFFVPPPSHFPSPSVIPVKSRYYILIQRWLSS